MPRRKPHTRSSASAPTGSPKQLIAGLVAGAPPGVAPATVVGWALTGPPATSVGGVMDWLAAGSVALWVDAGADAGVRVSANFVAFAASVALESGAVADGN